MTWQAAGHSTCSDLTVLPDASLDLLSEKKRMDISVRTFPWQVTKRQQAHFPRQYAHQLPEARTYYSDQGKEAQGFLPGGLELPFRACCVRPKHILLNELMQALQNTTCTTVWKNYGIANFLNVI